MCVRVTVCASVFVLAEKGLGIYPTFSKGFQFYEALLDLDFSNNRLASIQDSIFEKQVGHGLAVYIYCECNPLLET